MSSSAPAKEADSPLEAMKRHARAMFQKDVVEVAQGVHVAVGYAPSNSSMIVGDDGVVIIDTGQSSVSARQILTEFRKISDKPVKAVIYTHGHPDHICGARTFVDAGDNPEIYARANLVNVLDDAHLDRVGPYRILQKRTRRQYSLGLLEPNTEVISMGLGSAEASLEKFGKGFLPPTKTFDGEKMEVSAAGIELVLYKAPGETDDQLFVWYPAKNVLFSGDNFYQTFPNLYAIRGTVYRDFNLWADSLDHMTKFPVEHLVPGHTRPISGPPALKALTDYRDAIRFVIAKTAEGMNQGLTPDELVSYVKLPENLAGKFYLQEFLGTVAWSVRAYFAGNLGWFDGNPTNLFPLAPRERAERIAKLAGGGEALWDQLQNASAKGEHQWCLELADMVMALGIHEDQASEIKAKALVALADLTTSAIGRNYYLAYAKELRENPAS